MKRLPPNVLAALKAKQLEVGTPTLLELKAKVEAAGFEFGPIIKGEYVNMYPTGYTNEAGEDRQCWMTWHPTKTEKATHTPKNFDTKTFQPLTEDDFFVPLQFRKTL